MGSGLRLAPKTGGTKVETPATPLLVYFLAFTMSCVSDFPPAGCRLVLKRVNLTRITDVSLSC